MCLIFHRKYCCFRPVKEGLMDMTAITCATGVIPALIIVICVVIYIGRKRGKIFCNKHVQKGKKKNYINVTGIFFYQ